MPLGVHEFSLVGQAMTRGDNDETKPTIAPSAAGVGELDLAKLVQDREDGRLALLEPMPAEVFHVLADSGSRSASAISTRSSGRSTTFGGARDSGSTSVSTDRSGMRYVRADSFTA